MKKDRTLYKNQVETVSIEDYGSDGAGIAHINGEVVFVPETARGDICKIRVVNTRSHFAWGEVEELIEPAACRITPDCAAFPRCGGCTMRHVTYTEELRFKETTAKEALRRIGGAAPDCLPIIGADTTIGYRNKAQYPVRCIHGRTAIGFYEKNSHTVVACTNCQNETPQSRQVVEQIALWMRENRISAYDEGAHTGLVRHICVRTSRNGSCLACVIVTKTPFTAQDKLVAALRQIPGIAGVLCNVNTRTDNVIFGTKTIALWGADYITETLLGRTFRLSIDSFFQINPAQTEKLYAVVRRFMGEGCRELLDLYCGVGSIGLCLSDLTERLTGVEVVSAAVRDAAQNAKENGVANARFLCADAGEAAARLAAEGCRPDVVVVDPPRKGMDASCIRAILEMSPIKIIYVSCNPATQARDVALLTQNGYYALALQPVDMFPRSTHVETVCLLSKLHAEHHIEVNLNLDEMDLTASESKATYL